MRTALITGANGQDGVLLGHYLLSLGYRVTGLVRGLDRAVTEGVVRKLVPGQEGWGALLAEVRPDEIYHLGGDSFAGMPREGAVKLLESNVMLTARLLEAVRLTVPHSKVFLASSAVTFGDPVASPQDESSPRAANSLYGASKALLHPLADEYRKAGLFIRLGILFNHESILRPERFVTRKITSSAARIAAGQQQEMMLGNLDVVRDWGAAEDFVRAMHLMLQSEVMEDRVIATGEGRTVREFCRLAFDAVGLDYTRYVKMAPEFWRPAEPVPLVGNSHRLREETGWKPDKSFQTMIAEMTEADVRQAAGEGPGWKPEGGKWLMDFGNFRVERGMGLDT